MKTEVDWSRVVQMTFAASIVWTLYGWRLGLTVWLFVNVLAPQRER